MWVQILENIFSDVSKNVKFDEHLNNFCLFLDMYLDILDTLGLKTSGDNGVYWTLILVQQTFFLQSSKSVI